MKLVTYKFQKVSLIYTRKENPLEEFYKPNPGGQVFLMWKRTTFGSYRNSQ